MSEDNVTRGKTLLPKMFARHRRRFVGFEALSRHNCCRHYYRCMYVPKLNAAVEKEIHVCCILKDGYVIRY